MRREYKMDESEWSLIFDAPLTEDFVERVHNVTGTSNANIHTFDSTRGLHIKTTSAGQYGVKYVMPQTFLDAVYTTGELRLLTVCEMTKISGGNGVPAPFRMDNTASDTDTTKPVYVCQIGSTGFNTNFLNLPNNVSIKLFEDQTYDYTNLSRVPETTLVYSDYNDNTATRTWYNTNIKSRPHNCPYLRIVHAINTGSISEVYIKNLKIYRHQ